MTKVSFFNQTSKRKIASFEGAQIDLKNDLPLLFDAFHKAVIDFEKEIVLTPKEARARGLEASLLNSKVLYRVQQNFPGNWKFCKYQRFVLRIQSYNILIKKLNSKDMPMNVKTQNSEAINYQLSLPLFGFSDVADPILYFGYKKDRFGSIIDPKLVYVDEGNVCWTITESQLFKSDELTMIHFHNESSAELTIRPELRMKNVLNK